MAVLKYVPKIIIPFFRLNAQLFLAGIVSIAHFIPNDLDILIIFALFGYILSSVDLIFLLEK